MYENNHEVVETIEVIEKKVDLVVDSINELVAQKKFGEIKKQINELEPFDIAEVFEELNPADLPIVFRLLSKDNAADTFVEMSSDYQETLINAFSDAELKAVFDDMFVDDTVDVIEEMPASVVKRIINQTDLETRQRINEILQYPEDSAGTIMTVEYVSLKKEWTIAQCLEYIRKIAVDKETIYTSYVTDAQRRLEGVVSAKDLLIASPSTTVGSIMTTDFICVTTDTDKEKVATTASDYDLASIPVVDKENRIVGIITIDDIIDVIHEEATEDFAKMAAVLPTDQPYLEQSVWSIVKSRLPWLLLLMISATFTGLIINSFEHQLSLISTVLFACVPMLMGTGGNAGSQVCVTITRALALDEVEFKDILTIIWKELRVSILLALTLAVSCFAKLQLIDRLLFGYEGYTFAISAIVSLALFITILVAKIVGCTLPLLAKKCKLDPAVVANPFITTIVDALSLLTYCGVAVALLG
ncbi:MAG: magnesium transporter [Clostridia bacterium]|nr:magnesium transporter [Clostridia bacterium]